MILPRDDTRRDFVHDAADWGKMVHRWKAHGVVEAEEGRKNHERLLHERIAASGIDRDVVWPGFMHEIGVAVDCASDAVELMSGHGSAVDAWKAAKPESWIVGTCDGWAEMDGWLVVDDLKTGRMPPDPDCAQMLLYATAAMHDRRVDRAILRITHWPRYPRGGKPQFITKSITADDIAGFRADCRAGYDRYLEAKSLVVPDVPATLMPVLDTGEHCRYCDSRGACPAYAIETNATAIEERS